MRAFISRRALAGVLTMASKAIGSAPEEAVHFRVKKRTFNEKDEREGGKDGF